MKKIFRARLYKEQGKTEEAYKTIEEVLLSQRPDAWCYIFISA